MGPSFLFLNVICLIHSVLFSFLLASPGISTLGLTIQEMVLRTCFSKTPTPVAQQRTHNSVTIFISCMPWADIPLYYSILQLLEPLLSVAFQGHVFFFIFLPPFLPLNSPASFISSSPSSFSVFALSKISSPTFPFYCPITSSGLYSTS